jgi:hypothetical protein
LQCKGKGYCDTQKPFYSKGRIEQKIAENFSTIRETFKDGVDAALPKRHRNVPSL